MRIVQEKFEVLPSIASASFDPRPPNRLMCIANPGIARQLKAEP